MCIRDRSYPRFDDDTATFYTILLQGIKSEESLKFYKEINLKDKYSRIIHPLKPLYDENSKVLILGSFPSVKTREYGFFYGHKQNRFWKIMEILFETTLTRDIDERKYFLLGHHIALYDSIYACDIIGSSDASIKLSLIHI